MIDVLIADDSALMRKIIKDLISSDPDIKVVGTAMNGIIAVEKAKSLTPNVILMDVEMPDMDGISAVKKIMQQNPTPIIMLSALTSEGSKYAIEALEAGAIDFITKPSGAISLDIDKIRKELIDKIKVVARAQIRKLQEAETKKYKFNPTRRKILLIAASTGGPQTLEFLLRELPSNIPVPILIVQHMPPGFTKSFADRLSKICDIRVKEAEDNEMPKNGWAYIAPGGYHMELQEEDGKEIIKLNNKDPPEVGVMPCANKLFRSAAPIYGENTIGVILTGMGNDGTDGSRMIKKYHGTIIAEAEESCIIYGMPKEVIQANLADEIVPLDKMAVALLQILDV